MRTTRERRRHAPAFPRRSFDALTVAFGLRNMASWSRPSRKWHASCVPAVTCSSRLFPAFARAPARGLPILSPRILPIVAGVVTATAAPTKYLGESIEKFPSGAAMTQLLEAPRLHPRAGRAAHGRNCHHLHRDASLIARFSPPPHDPPPFAPRLAAAALLAPARPRVGSARPHARRADRLRPAQATTKAALDAASSASIKRSTRITTS